MEALYVLVFFLALGAAIVWVSQFVQLMALGDRDFPGKYDKVLWVGAFLVANVLAAIAFHNWNRRKVSLREEKRDRDSPPGPQEGITEFPHR
jgi:type VI protein secretion system component VasK